MNYKELIIKSLEENELDIVTYIRIIMWLPRKSVPLEAWEDILEFLDAYIKDNEDDKDKRIWGKQTKRTVKAIISLYNK